MADNHELARLFEEIATLLELKGDNPFKIRAYQSAARFLEELDEELLAFVASGAMEKTKGFGQAIGQKVREYLDTGRLSFYEDLKASVPAVLFELVSIPGLGPKKALQLHEKLHITSVGELEYACRENRLIGLPGFGAKTQAKLLQGIEYLKKHQGRFLLSEAWPLAEKIADFLRRLPGVDRVEVAGSIRRRMETVKDIDIVLASDQPAALQQLIAGMPGIQQVLSQGPAKVSLKLVTGINVDIRLVRPEEMATALHHLTGSKDHHIALRGWAKERGLKINEYGLEAAAEQRLAVQDEPRLYQALGLPFIPPELREGMGEIQAAAAGRLPELVKESDVRGVLHVHTTYSDGSSSLAELAAAAQRRGWQYLGITDHSRTAVYARGLQLETVLEQRREIERLNEANPQFRVLAGIESDILADGSLDYPDAVLAEFDFVIASVHSFFRLSEADMTQRIVTALSNRYVSILGHPTGRILLAREGYAVNLDAVLEAAAATGTIVEINASPYRLDLDWRWCFKAREKGLLLAVNPDAHAVDELDSVRFGIATARKGWLSAGDIVNTRPAREAWALLRRKRP